MPSLGGWQLFQCLAGPETLVQVLEETAMKKNKRKLLSHCIYFGPPADTGEADCQLRGGIARKDCEDCLKRLSPDDPDLQDKMEGPTVKHECVYRGDQIDADFLHCRRFDRCRIEDSKPDAPCCRECRERLTLADKDFAARWIDWLPVFNARKEPAGCLRGLLAGGPAFLVCGGPSAKGLPLERLNDRGCWTLGVNNAGGHPRFRANAFVCSDPPMKFSHSIWLDPQVMKFVPTPKLSGSRAKLRRKDDGVFSRMDKKLPDCPNVWAFNRLSWMTPDEQFFLADGACWGNLNSGVQITSERKTVCTMLLGMRLLRYLGAGRVYLVGVDFLMRPGEVYSFDQGKEIGGCQSNNNQFEVVNDWLCRMQEGGTFSRFGIEFYNCNRNSGLRAFPHVPFDDALDDAIGQVEQETDLAYWYDKASCPKCGSWHVRCGEGEWECMDCGEEWKP